jgi:hypothetical protein
MRGQAIEKRRRSHRGAQQRDILPVAVVVVDGGVTRIVIADLAGRMCVRVPNRLAPCHPRRLPSIWYGEVATPQRKSSAMPPAGRGRSRAKVGLGHGLRGGWLGGEPGGPQPSDEGVWRPGTGGRPIRGVRGHRCSPRLERRRGGTAWSRWISNQGPDKRRVGPGDLPGPRSQRRITGRRRVRTRGAVRRARFADR